MCSASSFCRWASTPSLIRPGSTPSSWARVVQHLVDEHPQAVLGLGVLHLPHRGDAVGGLVLLGGDLGHGARRRHPVERLVRAAVAVHEHRPVGLDQQQPGRQGEVGRQPPVVVHLALRNHQPHEASPYGRRPTVARAAVGERTLGVTEVSGHAAVLGNVAGLALVVATFVSRDALARPRAGHLGSCELDRRRAQAWRDRAPPAAGAVPPVLLALELSRLAAHIRRVEAGDLPRKAERLDGGAAGLRPRAARLLPGGGHPRADGDPRAVPRAALPHGVPPSSAPATSGERPTARRPRCRPGATVRGW